MFLLNKGIFMGQVTSQKRTLSQSHYSQSSAKKPFVTYKNHSIRLAVYTAAMVSASTMLMGCQANTKLSQYNQTSATTIDFSVANSSRNQAQFQAFSSQLNANAEQYKQLFDQSKHPNMETQAKTRLLSAIRQHLAGEHVAVSRANYHSVPYIKADSIDAGSSSFFRTLLELYAYKNKIIDNYDAYEGASEAAEEDSGIESETDSYSQEGLYADDVVAVKVEESSATGSILYDEFGYDANGYDKNSYDRDGYDEYGNHQDEDVYNQDRNDNDHESDNSSGNLASKIRGINVRRFLSEYENMQASKAATGTQDENASRTYPGVMTQLINMFIRTPEQVQAMNTYHYQYLTLNSVSHYKPKDKKLQSVYSYDYLAPTISSSIQLPIGLDFNKSVITIDPSALLPIVALVNPEHAPLPTQMSSHTVNFGLPEAITSQIPSAVIYDAVIAALQNSMAELEPEYFSAVDIRDDTFAKQVGANKAIKVYFGSKQSGEMLGKMIKNISRSLQNHIDKNPNSYPDDSVLKNEIARLELYNKGYQSADVGALLQLVEAVSPISFNHVNYYYLDGSERLLAKQQRLNIGSDFFGSQNTVLNQTRYDSASFNKHPLTALLTQSFGEKAPTAIDGNAWLREQSQQKERLEKARYARYDYIEEDVEAAEASVDYVEDAVNFSRDTRDVASDMEGTDYMDAEASSFEGEN